jgi:hypothetical protein
MALFEISSWHSEGLSKTKKILSQNIQCPSWDSNQEPPKYKEEALLLEPTCSVIVSNARMSDEMEKYVEGSDHGLF